MEMCVCSATEYWGTYRIITFHTTWSHMQPVNILFNENEHSMKTSLKDVTGM